LKSKIIQRWQAIVKMSLNLPKTSELLEVAKHAHLCLNENFKFSLIKGNLQGELKKILDKQ